MSEQVTYNKGFVVFIATIVAFGGLLFGFDTGVISGAILLIKNDPNIVINGVELAPRLQEWIVSITVLGAAIGALGSGRISDTLGRKKVIIFTAFVFAVGSVGLALANSVTGLIVWRLIIGIAIGVASYTVPLYISEVSPSHVRGALVSINQLAITVGIFASYIVDLGFAGFEDGWRWMFLVGLVPSLILFLGMFFLPESPRWLMSYHSEGEARKVLDRVGESNKEDVIEQIKKNIRKEEKAGGGLKELLGAKWVRPALIIGVGIMFFQQFTGINTIIYYSPTIFEMAGFGLGGGDPVFNAILPALPIGFINVLFTLVAMYYVDKWGRKPLLYLGLGGMIVSLITIGIAFTAFNDVPAAIKWMSFVSMIVYIPFFAISLGPIAWLLISEVFPTKIRGLGMSIATMVNWVCNFIVANTFLTLGRVTTGVMPSPVDPNETIINLGGAFFIYAAVGVVGLFFVYRFIPETKGHSLEEIEEHFQAGGKANELT